MTFSTPLGRVWPGLGLAMTLTALEPDTC
eukprot:COSAG03_NODE_17270_length_379_cov_1.275000_2_plen_28_part_01